MGQIYEVHNGKYNSGKNDDLKIKSDELLKDIVIELALLEKLEKSREHAAQGMFRDADKVSYDLRAKYGL